MGKVSGEDGGALPVKQQQLQQQFTETYQEIQALKEVLKGYLQKTPNAAAPPLDVSLEHAAGGRTNQDDSPREKTPPVVSSKFKPSKESERILANSQQGKVPFLERVKLHVDRHEQSTKSLKEHVLAAEDVETTFSPAINPKSKRMDRRIDHLWSWHHDKQTKLEARRVAAEQRELAQVTPVPVCSAKSNQMLQRCSSYNGGHSAQRSDRVEDRLHRYGETISAKQSARRGQAPCPFQPTLSCHSARLRRDGDAHTRLYNLAAKRPPPEPPILSTTRQPPTTPLDPHTSQLCRRLHDEANANQEKLQRIRAAEARHLNQLQNAPKISATSLKLARHVSARKTSSPRASPQQEKQQKQHKRAIRVKEAEQVYLKQVQWKQQREAKTAQEREAQLQYEIAQCTFTNPYRPEEDSPVKGNDSYFRKAMEWERRRQQIVSEKQQRLLLEMLKHCTFRPHTNPGPQEELAKTQPTLDSMLSMFRVEQNENCLRTPPKHQQPSQTPGVGASRNSLRISAGEDARILPYPWEEYVTEDGFLYYVNTLTRASQWEFP